MFRLFLTFTLSSLYCGAATFEIASLPPLYAASPCERSAWLLGGPYVYQDWVPLDYSPTLSRILEKIGYNIDKTIRVGNIDRAQGNPVAMPVGGPAIEALIDHISRTGVYIVQVSPTVISRLEIPEISGGRINLNHKERYLPEFDVPGRDPNLRRQEIYSEVYAGKVGEPGITWIYVPEGEQRPFRETSNWQAPLHTHTQSHASLVVAGKARVAIQVKTSRGIALMWREMVPGDMAFFPKGVPHTFYCDAGFQVLSVTARVIDSNRDTFLKIAGPETFSAPFVSYEQYIEDKETNSRPPFFESNQSWLHYLAR